MGYAFFLKTTKMNRLNPYLLLLFFVGSFFTLNAQNGSKMEIEANSSKSISDARLKKFYERFEAFISSLSDGQYDKYKVEVDDGMIPDYIGFSEDGLIMKRSQFVSIEACKSRLEKHLSGLKKKYRKKAWLFVGMESHVNKNELMEILTILDKLKIEYRFGIEDYYVPMIHKLD